MRILAIRADQQGCGSYRVTIPMSALADRGHECDVADIAQHIQACNKDLAGYDIIILQKVKDPGWIDLVESIPSGLRPKVVYEVDDLLWEMDETNPSYREFKLTRKAILETMRRADAVTCTTPYLETAIRTCEINRNVHVVPNFLDLDLRNWTEAEPRGDDCLRIGWAGGLHHVGDCEPMAKALRNVLQSHPRVKFAICTQDKLAEEWRRELKLSQARWLFLEGRDFRDYPSRISQFDIGLAPLRNTPFNRCKSDLKVLEYGAWGVPIVASALPPYTLWRGMNVACCRNAGEWEEALSNLVQAHEERRWRGECLKASVWGFRNRQKCGEAWERALTEILNGEKGEVNVLLQAAC